MSDITDLSEEGILTQSVHMVSLAEKKRLTKYKNELKKKQKQICKLHDIPGQSELCAFSKPNVEMELRLREVRKP